MKSFKQYLEEARYEDWNYDIPRHGKFESNQDNIYYAQKVLKDAPKELIDEVKASIEKDGKLPAGKEFDDVYKAMFVMKHAADVKNLAAMKDKELSSKQKDFEELVNKVGLDSEQVLNNGEKLAEKDLKEKKTTKKDDTTKDEEPTKETDDKKTDTGSKEDSVPDEGEADDGTPDDTDTKEGESGNTSTKKDDTTKDEKPKERSVDSTNSEESKQMVKDTIQKLKDKAAEYADDEDRTRAKRISNIQNKYNAKANKLLDTIRKQEGKLSDPKLPFDWKVNAKRDIAKSIADIERETNKVEADMSIAGTRNAGEKVAKGVRDAVKGVKDAGKKIAGSKAGYSIGKAAQNSTQGMKQAVSKAKEVASNIAKSKTGQATQEKIQQVQGKVKSGIKKADTAVADVINKGKESDTYKKGASAMSSISRKIKDKASQAKKGVKNISGKLSTAGQAMKAGVEAANKTMDKTKTAAQKKKEEELKKKLEAKFIKKKEEDKDKVKQAAV